MNQRVLILCTGNSCRSQMAEGLWREMGAGQWEACSAGSRPAGYVHPLAIEAMRQRGIDIAAGRSKSVDEFQGQSFDLVVTVCDHAREACPVFPSAKQTLHWPFDDPAHATGTPEQQISEFVRVRDEIERRIAAYLGLPGDRLA
ncbi:MAG: arsenate reductase ArsC [Pirellulaceae bacterium]|nr:arsenate reductase ArsC [Pirellulaceae bacterium]